ncbi:MAG: L,D-transpeptidase [Lacisediminihabitans sp.]
MVISRAALVVVLVAAGSTVALPTAAVALARHAPPEAAPAQVTRVQGTPSSTTPTAAATPAIASPSPAAPSPAAAAPVDLAALPEARYDAVIPGLLGYSSPLIPDLSRVAYSLRADAPLSAEPGAPPIARFAATNFLGEPTVVVRVALQGRWALVLTPARSALPSQSGGAAPAQTAGWIPVEALVHPVTLRQHIVISLSRQELAIVAGDTVEQSFAVGVGTTSTPTPQGVTGYLQARYLDPAQHQDRYPVQLSSLHSAAADEPFGGTDGGLIGVHYERTATGAVSHGCVRLSAEAVRAVDSLPLGTPITITG